MSSRYLLEPAGLAELSRFVAPDTLFAFDLDGTLAPIQVHASDVKVDHVLSSFLQKLMQHAQVCVLTGRSRKDALTILPFEAQLVIGNHGCEWPPEIRPRNADFIEMCQGWRDRLADELSDDPGIFIEYKGESLAVHYRGAQYPETALQRIEGIVTRLVPAPRVIGGKYVMNLLPMQGQTKGEALVAAVAQTGATRAVYVGDDLTDEEVFRMDNGLDLLGVHIGEDDLSAAPFFLKAQSELLRVIEVVVGLFQEQRQPTRP